MSLTPQPIRLRRAATIALVVLAAVLPAGPAPAAGAEPRELAREAVSPDARTAEAAIATLRARGPAGLEALRAVHGAQVARWFPDPPAQAASADQAAWRRIRHAFDKVAGQLDAHASRLYWHTELAAARAAARAAGRPILSLRLLGRLDESLSCANSRFFRTALYAHPEVAAMLRERFVLHWSSERPVPVVTIDFGDGRKLRRTLTGNSAHHVLDPEGRLVDTIPGLWGHLPFRAELEAARFAALASWRKATPERRQALTGYHRHAYDTLVQARDVALARLNLRAGDESTRLLRTSPTATPPAAVAGELAESKAIVQMPLLRAIGEAPAQTEWLTEATVSRLAAAANAGRLHPASVALMRDHLPPGADPATDLPAVVASFERSIAADTVRNRLDLRPKVHQAWLEATPDVDLEAWNARLYADVFLTPRSDPWLGLLLPDRYTGLPDAGVQ